MSGTLEEGYQEEEDAFGLSQDRDEGDEGGMAEDQMEEEEGGDPEEKTSDEEEEGKEEKKGQKVLPSKASFVAKFARGKETEMIRLG